MSAEKFWDGVANRYAKSPIKNMAAYEQTLDCTRVHLSDTDKVLEVGCGTGTTALLLADDVAHITATDISGRMIEIGQSKARAKNVENVSFEQATLDKHPFEQNSFDRVMAFNFLHLLEDPVGGLRQVQALLRPGGLFISKTVCLGERSSFWRGVIFLMRKLGLAPYVNFLDYATLEAMVTKAGFEILETGVYPANRPSRFLVARKL